MINPRTQLTADQLQNPDASEGPVDDAFFAPIEPAGAAQHGLAASIAIPQTPMQSNQPGVRVNGKAIDVFPAVILRLSSSEGDLVPLDRGLLRDPDGDSYWDLTLSPGKVFSEESDGHWSRAVLPFQLSNIFENDTHHGIATFLFNETDISSIFFQIVVETKAFLVPDNLLAWGWLEGCVERLGPNECDLTCKAYREEKRDRLPMKSLNIWHSKATEDLMRDIEQGFGGDSSIVNGLVKDEVIYVTPCRTARGDYPYPRSMRFGIWSATKTAFCTIAYLRLAQVMKEDPRSYEVATLLPEARGNEKWSGITIGHCMDMAAGIGTGAQNGAEPNVFGDYLIEPWQSRESEEGLNTYNHYHK